MSWLREQLFYQAVWVELIPSLGFRTRLAWCVLGHPFRVYARGACFVWSVRVAPLGELGSEIGHLGESIVELILPFVPGTNLEPIAGSEDNHFFG